MAVAGETWLALMRAEYFADFIPAGGAAVRFVVVADGAAFDRLAADLAAAAGQAGLLVVSVDLATTRLQLLQNLVFAVAAALPWERLLQRRLEALVAAAGYRWPAPGQRLDLPALAAANEVAAHLLWRDLTQALSREIWRDAGLTQDFRNAMIVLLQARLSGEDGALAASVMDWLHGRLRSLAPLKPARIGRRIDRRTARATLMSLCRWLRACAAAPGADAGGAEAGGLLLLLDIRRLHRERRAVADGLVYTPAAVMDCYEVLRQLIDDCEHFPGLFVAALADPALLSDDPRRALGQYTALQMRVWDDVRPAEGDNPLAPLVRIAG
jgi:hypothetical protein